MLTGGFTQMSRSNRVALARSELEARLAEWPEADRKAALESHYDNYFLTVPLEDQVRLAERAAREMVEGREVHMDALVVSLRDFIRAALDLDPIPANLAIPRQGPSRPSSSGGKGEGGRGGGRPWGCRWCPRWR